jgi:hypothetical protein
MQVYKAKYQYPSLICTIEPYLKGNVSTKSGLNKRKSFVGVFSLMGFPQGISLCLLGYLYLRSYIFQLYFSSCIYMIVVIRSTLKLEEYFTLS